MLPTPRSSGSTVHVLSVLMYGSETWTMLKSDVTKLQAFDMQNQRCILGIHWFDFIKNEEVSRISGPPPIDIVISQRRHSLFGHVRRMDSRAPAHQALHLAVSTVWLEPQGQTTTGEDHKDIRAIPGSSRSSPTTSPYLMPGQLQWIGRRGGRYDPTMVKCSREEYVTTQNE